MKKLIRLGLCALVGLGAVVAGAPQGKTEEVQKDLSREIMPSVDAIKNVAERGAPMAVWGTLEHGERLECLDCISYVEPLLFDKDARVREIAAWWLRKRVFGYAAVALKVRKVVETDPSPERRAAAAEALGEFLDPGGTPHLIKAASDASAPVRAAVMSAFRRLNDPDAVPVVTKALSDTDASVRFQALTTAVKLAGFRDVAEIAKLLSDPDVAVRSRAADALGVFKAKGSVAGLSALAVTDNDEDVRVNAVNALGEIGDPAARTAIEKAKNDPSSRVQDAAYVAGLKLAL